MSAAFQGISLYVSHRARPSAREDGEPGALACQGPCHSEPRDRARGVILRSLILEAKSGNAATFAPWLSIPLGAHMLDALLKLPVKTLVAEPWLVLRLKRPKTVVILPNLWWRNADARSITRCRNAIRSGRFGDQWRLPELASNIRHMAKAWEASLWPTFSAAMTAVATLQWRPPMPSAIDLKARTERPWQRNSNPWSPPGRWPLLREQSRKLLSWDTGRTCAEWTPKAAAASLAEAAASCSDVFEGCGIRTLASIYGPRMIPGHVSHYEISIKTAHRQARSLFRALDAARAWHEGKKELAKRLQQRFNNVDRFALKMLGVELKASGISLPERLAVSVSNARRFAPPLVNPNYIFERFGLLSPCPAGDSGLGQSARRVAADILVYCGRRARCLLHVGRQHFRVARHPFTKDLLLELTIPSSKTTALRGCIPLPLHALWPAEDLEHLRRFLLDWSNDDVRSEWRLVELVAGRRIEPDPEKTYHMLRRELPDDHQPVRLHDGRREFGTWWLVRVLSLKYRAILDLPALTPLKDCPWFRDQNLDRLADLLPSGELPVEVGRRILLSIPKQLHI